MKKKIGNLRGKPIIEGDKNLMTANELHISELGGGNSGSERYVYFRWEGNNQKIMQSLPDVTVTFNGTLLITDIYSNSLSKNINIVISAGNLGSGFGDATKVSGLALTNVSIPNPMDGTELNAIDYLQLLLQADDFPHKEDIEFLFEHKVSEEEFFKDVQAYIP